MARPLKDIEQELLTLPRKERADIVLRVIRSLDEGIEEDVDAYWREELVRRSQKNESGKAATDSRRRKIPAGAQAL